MDMKIPNKYVFFKTKDLVKILKLNPRTINRKINNDEIIGKRDSKKGGFFVRKDYLINYIKTLKIDKQEDCIKRIELVQKQNLVEQYNELGIAGDNLEEVFNELGKLFRDEINRITKDKSSNNSINAKTIKNPILKNIMMLVEKAPDIICEATANMLREPEFSNIKVSPINETAKDLLEQNIKAQIVDLKKTRAQLKESEDILLKKLTDKRKDLTENNETITQMENRLNHLDN